MDGLVCLKFGEKNAASASICAPSDSLKLSWSRGYWDRFSQLVWWTVPKCELLRAHQPIVSARYWRPKICNLPKTDHIWAAQWLTSSELKIKFDPWLERSWCELFKIINIPVYGPKDPLQGSLGPGFPSKSSPSVVISKTEIGGSVLSIS